MTLRKWAIDDWVTVSFVPTTGWTNHFHDDEGALFSTPCPGALVQERRAVTRYQEVLGNDERLAITSTTTECEPPFDTRVVAADIDFGYLEPAQDVGNFSSTSVLPGGEG